MSPLTPHHTTPPQDDEGRMKGEGGTTEDRNRNKMNEIRDATSGFNIQMLSIPAEFVTADLLVDIQLMEISPTVINHLVGWD